jgi:hypothetical protein
MLVAAIGRKACTARREICLQKGDMWPALPQPGFSIRQQTVRICCLLGGLHASKEYIYDDVGGVLQLGIAFSLRGPGEETVEDIPGQTIVQEDCQPFD